MPRGFDPARINSWLDQAEYLSSKSATADLGFLIAFTSWEALQCRILAIALRQQGYSMAVSHEYLGKTVHNDRLGVRKIFEFVLLKPPAQTKGLGKGWQVIERHRETRKRFAHGLGTANPRELVERTHEMLSLMRDTSWLEATPVPLALGSLDSGMVPLGPVMGSLKSVRSNGFGAEHISSRIRVLRKAK